MQLHVTLDVSSSELERITMAISQAAQAIVAAIEANTAALATLATSDGAQAATDLAAINDAVTAQTAAIKAAGATPPTGGITISPATLPVPVVGIPYNVQLTAEGGAAPYAFSVSPSTTIPAGLTLSAAGLISGTPSTSGTYGLDVVVTDSAGATATATYNLTF